MVRKSNNTCRHVRRVIVDDAIHRAFMLIRIETGEPVQSQINKILTDYLRRQKQLQPESSAAS